MTEQELAEIREFIRRGADRWVGDEVETVVGIINRLLDLGERLRAENADLLDKNANMSEALLSAAMELQEVQGPRVAHLTAENAALREIAQQVAVRHDGICMFCKHTVDRHTQSCVIAKARELLSEIEEKEGKE